MRMDFNLKENAVNMPKVQLLCFTPKITKMFFGIFYLFIAYTIFELQDVFTGLQAVIYTLVQN